jgi:hypothetical protein
MTHALVQLMAHAISRSTARVRGSYSCRDRAPAHNLFGHGVAVLEVVEDCETVGGMVEQPVGRFNNFARFNSPKWNGLVALAARLTGPARYLAYGKLDVELARDTASLAATTNVRQIALVSTRTGCARLDPAGSFDLAAVCLR